jgi:hypothetical protein
MAPPLSVERHRIRVLNDNFRTTFVGGTVMLTLGVNELPIDVKAKAILMVKTYKEFTNDNDPYGEHDFGSFEVENQKFYWKIDYYDLEREFGSENPSDPDKTERVLTIMLAGEY